MLTTNQMIQNATSLLWPSLLILVAWYSIAASLRAFFEFGYRWFHRKRVASRVRQVATTPLTDDNSNNTTPMFIPFMENRLEGLQDIVQESLLIGRGATKTKIILAFIEGLLFAGLAVVAFYGAKPVIHFNMSWLGIHTLGVIFFLCFILRARRILLLIPLTFIVWTSWEIFSFITSFEQTLTATSLLATVEILDRTKDDTEKVKIALTFKGKNTVTIVLPAQKELLFKGRVYRVAPEVLLFGGKNIASIDQVFSDDMKPKNAISILSTEEIPLSYRWQNYRKNYRALLHKKMSYWLWQQFFKLRKTKFIKIKLLEAPRCSPIRVGQKFELRLRNVGGLECHQKSYTPPKIKKLPQQKLPQQKLPQQKLPQQKLPQQKIKKNFKSINDDIQKIKKLAKQQSINNKNKKENFKKIIHKNILLKKKKNIFFTYPQSDPQKEKGKKL